MKYRKKPAVIDAVQFYDDTENLIELGEFIKGAFDLRVSYMNKSPVVLIPTLEGTMTANEGDYIIKGLKGEFYPCKPEIFVMSYELVTE